jgi:polysaccharide biosynthesis/export protein
LPKRIAFLNVPNLSLAQHCLSAIVATNFFGAVMKFIKVYLCLVWLISSSIFGNANSQVISDYELGGGDSVKISVFLSPELTTEVRLSELGTVSLPMVGTVKLGGMTIAAAENHLANKLREGNFIQKAQVTMAITTYRSQQVSVLGNVGRPGRYPLEVKGTRLTELIAQAGGISATGADVLVFSRRDAQGNVTTREIDIPSIFLNNDKGSDVVLQGGDSIYVHRQPIYYIYGQVGRPGNYTIERGMTVAQAIAKGGSFTLRSRESGVRLLRRDSRGSIVETTPKMDELLKPDDQIFVRESLF